MAAGCDSSHPSYLLNIRLSVNVVMRKDKEGKKKGRKDKKLSMHPLPLEEALGAALKVKPAKNKPSRRQKET